MADSGKKTKANPMSMDSFRAKKAGAGSSGGSKLKTTGVHETKSSSKNSTTSKPDDTRSRPQSATRKTTRSRSASADSVNRSAMSIESRQDKVKQLRDKQAEDRKKKNEERRIAFEERRKQKQEEEKQKWDSLKQMAAIHRPGSGRKLPTLPDGPKRPSTAGSVPARPTGLPKSLKTTTMKSTGHGTDKKTPGSPARSSSSLSSDSSPKQSPTAHAKSFLTASKAVPNGNVSDTRRASTSNLYRPPSATKKRPSSIVDDCKMTTSKSHTSLMPATSTVKKAQSTSALHRIDTDKPLSILHKKHTPKKEKPKAGMLDEAAAKQALAERRKQAREEAERKAKLDLERQEVERKKKEEEEKRLAEEMAKEEERLSRLAELLKEQEEERQLKAIEEKEQRDREEAERQLAEEKQREEERKIREEEERLATIEAEKKAKEDEERRKQEEIERKERRRRVEEIMSRTRQAKTGSPIPETVETTSSSQEPKDIDVEDTKRKVTEILQKVKDRTEGHESPVTTQDEDFDSPDINTESTQVEQTDSETKTVEESTHLAEKSSENSDEEDPKPIQEVTSVASNSDSVFKVRIRISETRTETTVNGREIERTLSRETREYNQEDNQGDSYVTNGSMNGHIQTEQLADLAA